MVGQDAILQLLECQSRLAKVFLKDDEFNKRRLALHSYGQVLDKVGVLNVDKLRLHPFYDIDGLVIRECVDFTQVESLLVGVLHAVHLEVMPLKNALSGKAAVKESHVFVSDGYEVDRSSEGLNDL